MFTIGVLFFTSLGHMALYRWLMRFTRLAQRKRLVIAVLTIMAVTPFVARQFGAHADMLSHISRIEFMIVVLGSVPYAALIALVALFTRKPVAVTAAQKAESNVPVIDEPPVVEKPAALVPPPTPPATRREVLQQVAGGVAFGTSAVMCGWGYARGRHDYQVREVVVRVARLPKSLDGYTIAQVSDIHVGPFVGERELREGFDLVRKIRPDLVVATGDLVDSDAARAPLLARAFADLPARDGHIVIPGNHDYYAGAKAVLDTFRAAGVTTLVNQSMRVRESDRGGIAIAGVDDMWAAGHGGAGPNLAKALAGVNDDTPRVLLAHQPNYFTHARGQVDVQLSGHTHGGQIKVGFNPAALIFHYTQGRYEEHGSTLWVNSGFGVAGPPARINVPPEVTKIVLVSA